MASRKVFISFPDPEMERRFCNEFVQSDSHYKSARWAFYVLVVVYVLYLAGTSSVRAKFNMTMETESDIIRTLVVPVLNLVLFTMATVLAHVPSLRRFASWETVLVMAIGGFACIAVPLFSLRDLDVDSGFIFYESLFTFIPQPPLNSTFIDGFMLNSSDQNDICGGIGDARANHTHDVTLCQTMYFNAGSGNLAFFLSTVPTLHGLTLPTIAMSLALPFRHYLIAISIPFAGMLLQTYASYVIQAAVIAKADSITSQYIEHGVGDQYLWFVLVELVFVLVLDRFVCCWSSIWSHDKDATATATATACCLFGNC